MTTDALEGLDRVVLDAMQLPHFRWLDLAASVITVLGQGEVVGVVALGVTIVRLRARRRDWWVPLLFVVVLAIEIALKIVVPQAPPPRELVRNVKFAPFLEGFAPYAFPSGHVARTAFLVTALRWPSALAVLAVVVMSLTRIYLGEHWPSDVLGGWLLGYGIARVARRA